MTKVYVVLESGDYGHDTWVAAVRSDRASAESIKKHIGDLAEITEIFIDAPSDLKILGIES